MDMKRMALGFAVALIGTLSASVLLAQSFSIDLTSPGIIAPPGDSILGLGPVEPLAAPPLPAIALPVPILVAGTGVAPIEVDALSYHSTHDVFDGAVFSVASGSCGAPATAVATEAACAPDTGEQVADVYFATFIVPGNVLVLDGNGVATPGAAPPVGLPESAFANLDALDATVPPPAAGSATVYFSVSPASVAAYAAGSSPADIFSATNSPGFSAPTPTVYASEVVLGLAPGDDIDALHVVEEGTAGFGAGDTVYFHLHLAHPP